MHPPWYARKKIVTIDTHHIPAKKNRHKTQVYWTHSDSEINFTALTLLQLS